MSSLSRVPQKRSTWNTFEQVTYLQNGASVRFEQLFKNHTNGAKGKYLMSYLAPGYPSEYLLTRHEPRASSTARLVKF